MPAALTAHEKLCNPGPEKDRLDRRVTSGGAARTTPVDVCNEEIARGAKVKMQIWNIVEQQLGSSPPTRRGLHMQSGPTAAYMSGGPIPRALEVNICSYMLLGGLRGGHGASDSLDGEEHRVQCRHWI